MFKLGVSSEFWIMGSGENCSLTSDLVLEMKSLEGNVE